MNKILNDIITRAVMDEEFRKEFLSDPVKSVDDYNLSDDEVAQLRAIDVFELAQVNAELEERLSKSFINLPTTEIDERSHTSHSNGPSGGASHGSTSHSNW